MITGKKLFILANIESTQDENTGDRVKAVTSARRLVDTVELVGVHTAQLGQAQGFNFAFSVAVRRVYYGGEKYLYFDGGLFEIKGLSKHKEESKMLLNVQRFDDASIKAAIERWLSDL